MQSFYLISEFYEFSMQKYHVMTLSSIFLKIIASMLHLDQGEKLH